jgi:hypothetical protein
VTEEDNSQSAERAEKYKVSQMAQKAQMFLYVTQILWISQIYYIVPQKGQKAQKESLLCREVIIKVPQIAQKSQK